MNAILALVLRILLLVLVYLFVGWIGYTVFKDLRTLVRGRTDSVTTPILLQTVIEKEPIERQFIKTEVILGRDPDCDFTLSDETISLRHCQLSFHHDQWWVNDLNSTNGTFLNESPIESPVIITEGDDLRLGQISIHISFNP